MGNSFSDEQLYTWVIITVATSGIAITLSTARWLVHKFGWAEEEEELSKMQVCQHTLHLFVFLALAFWGIAVYNDIVNRDENPFWETNGGQLLWVYFNIKFWTSIAILCFACCCIPIIGIGICVGAVDVEVADKFKGLLS